MGALPVPPCSRSAKTQLQLITYQKYQHSCRASAVLRSSIGFARTLALPHSLFSLLLCFARSLAEPQDFGGGSGGGLGRAATSRAYPRPHFDLPYCLLISTSQMLLSSATERQIPEGEGSVVGREEMKAEKSCIY